uniref:Uncharacterized protein n=1 Tax=Arundo donax TaxID=35708 RepID=A0A0A9A1G7_ARUDO
MVLSSGLTSSWVVQWWTYKLHAGIQVLRPRLSF